VCAYACALADGLMVNVSALLVCTLPVLPCSGHWTTIWDKCVIVCCQLCKQTAHTNKRTHTHIHRIHKHNTYTYTYTYTTHMCIRIPMFTYIRLWGNNLGMACDRLLSALYTNDTLIQIDLTGCSTDMDTVAMIGDLSTHTHTYTYTYTFTYTYASMHVQIYDLTGCSTDMDAGQDW
jgi:hypothetical protein